MKLLLITLTLVFTISCIPTPTIKKVKTVESENNNVICERDENIQIDCSSTLSNRVDNAYFTRSCHSDGSFEDGECEIISCNSGFNLVNNSCVEVTCNGSTSQNCYIANGSGSQIRSCTFGDWSGWGHCQTTSCNNGYAIVNNSCVEVTCSGSSTQACSVVNGVGLQGRSCTAGNWSGWGQCQTTSCNSGYDLINNSCVEQTCSGNSTQACSVTNGVGSQGRSCTAGDWSGWGPCQIASCNTGFSRSGNQCIENGNNNSQALIVGWQHTLLEQVPINQIENVRNTLHIAYNHTSHGSQLITGLNALEGFPSFNGRYNWDDSGRDGYGLDLDDRGIGGTADLSQGDSENSNGDTPWTISTRSFLDQSRSNHINVIMWSWCNIGGHSMERYLRNMEKLISEYGPGGTKPRAAEYPVQFVFMTGHANGGGEDDSSDSRNKLIREHVIANNRILFDFSDIENYDPDGNYYLDKRLQDDLDYYLNGGLVNWATRYFERHMNSENYYLVKGVGDFQGTGSCAHSGSGRSDKTLNCVLKGKALWWLFARMAGWDGVTQ